jgi:hypothetical protein
VVLGNHLARLDPSEQPGLVRAVAVAMPDATIDYVRLNIAARRAG